MLVWPPWLKVALQEQEDEVEEIPGWKHNPRILQYHDHTSLDADTDEIPWCSSFVNFCMVTCSMKLAGTDSARARSWLEWGTALLIPPVGSVVILKRGGPGQPGPAVIKAQGHVGLMLSQNSTKIEVIGGNQSNRVCTKTYPVARVLGYRWPL